MQEIGPLPGPRGMSQDTSPASEPLGCLKSMISGLAAVRSIQKDHFASLSLLDLLKCISVEHSVVLAQNFVPMDKHADN